MGRKLGWSLVETLIVVLVKYFWQAARQSASAIGDCAWIPKKAADCSAAFLHVTSLLSFVSRSPPMPTITPGARKPILPRSS
jgi:hypothetical protein